MLDLRLFLSVAGDPPPGAITGGQDMVGLGGLALCLVLTAIALISIRRANAARRECREMRRKARRNARSMEELLRTVRMAETIGELGVWQYEMATCEQHWSEGMRAIFGVADDEPFVAGDAETLLFANDIDLVESVMLHCEDTEPFSLRFDARDLTGAPLCLQVQAYNLRRSDGEVVRVVAVVRDITQQAIHERELELEKARALSEAQEARALASTDPLTGLANRRRVMGELDHLIVRARQSRQSLSLIVFDLDHFKSVNDTFGHPVGDMVLQRVGEIAIDQARDTDLVGRVGGEEFVWIVPKADEMAAHMLAERLRHAIAVRSGFGSVPGVTASVGCAEMAATDSSLSLFARADAALYAAKNGGRNQVRLAA